MYMPRKRISPGVFEKPRSSHRNCSLETGVLKNFVNFTGKYMCQSLFFRPQACNFIRDSGAGVFL